MPSLCPGDSHPSFLVIIQVICKEWSNLAGKNYIILNMTENIDCVSAELGRAPAAGKVGRQWGASPTQGSCGTCSCPEKSASLQLAFLGLLQCPRPA